MRKIHDPDIRWDNLIDFGQLGRSDWRACRAHSASSKFYSEKQTVIFADKYEKKNKTKKIDAYKIRDERRVHWYTSVQSCKVKVESYLNIELLDDRLLKVWVDPTLYLHSGRVEGPWRSKVSVLLSFCRIDLLGIYYPRVWV